jgi:hypothetical protein
LVPAVVLGAIGSSTVSGAPTKTVKPFFVNDDSNKRFTNPKAGCDDYIRRQAAPGSTPTSAPADEGDGAYRCFWKESDGTERDISKVTRTCPPNSQSSGGTCTCGEGYVAAGDDCVVEDAAAQGTDSATAPGAEAAAQSAAPSPEERGMLPVDDAIFEGIAHNKKLYILVRDSNSAATQYMGKAGYQPKPEILKAKTRRTEPEIGVAAADPTDPKLLQSLAASSPSLTYDAYVKALSRQGFVVGPAPGYVIFSARSLNEKYYSDYDLHGVYDEKGQPAFKSAEFQQLMNERFKHPLIQHGPQDDWPKRESDEAGPNKGPQPPVTAYLPNGDTEYLQTIAEMKAFYARHKIPWPYKLY